jgi:hypothetical protein
VSPRVALSALVAIAVAAAGTARLDAASSQSQSQSQSKSQSKSQSQSKSKSQSQSKSQSKSKSKSKSKTRANKPDRTASKEAKHRSTKRKASAAGKAKHTAKRRGTRSRVKVATTPLVTAATRQVDGRVVYGADRLPPGFAWPPTPAMRKAAKACEDALSAEGIRWEPAPEQGLVAAPVTVLGMELGGIKYTSLHRARTPTLDCQFARALARIGPDLRALGVREVQFGSIYRNSRARSHGQTKTFLSRHALGIAMDIKAFVDDTGRVASVELDYLKGDPLLHAVEDLINRDTGFRWVLTPGNDPLSHDDHFHIEASVDFTSFR